jgi:hypothetical protein
MHAMLDFLGHEIVWEIEPESKPEPVEKVVVN